MTEISRTGSGSPVGGAVPGGQSTEVNKPAGQSIQQTSGHDLAHAPRSKGSDRMSQLRAQLPKLSTGGENSPASPKGEHFKTPDSTPMSASPFGSTAVQSSATPMSTHDFRAPGGSGGPPPGGGGGFPPGGGGFPPGGPTSGPAIPNSTEGLIAHMQQTNFNNQQVQLAMNEMQNGQTLFNTAMTAEASQRKILQELSEAQAKTATAGATAVKNLA